MKFKTAHLGRMALLLFALAMATGLLVPSGAFADIREVRMGVNGMI